MRLRDIPTAARVELLEPFPQRPSRRYLLQLATTNTQSFFNEIQSTGRAWAVGDQDLILTVQPNQSEYVLPVGNEFGRVLDVTTFDPSNDFFIERQIPFWELADQRGNWNAPRNMPNYGLWSPHSAQRMSFFKKGFGNDTYVSVWPVPLESCQYRILWAMGDWASTMALDDSPLLTQFHALLVVKTAMDALPGSGWWVDEQQNRLRRTELANSLSLRLPILMDQFKRYVQNVTVPRMTDRLTYILGEY